MALEINEVNEPLSYDPSNQTLSLELNSIEQSPIQISDDGHIILNIDGETLTVVQDQKRGVWMLAVSNSVTGGDDDLGLDYAFLGQPGQVYTVSEDGTEAVWMDPQGGGGGGTEYSFGTGLNETNNLVEVDTDFIASRSYVNHIEAGLQEEIEDFLVIVQGLGTLNIIDYKGATIERDDTKGVSPYNTSYGYTNITINSVPETELREGSLFLFLCDGEVLKVDSAYRNVRIRFGETGRWIPVYLSTSIAAGNSYMNAYASRILYYSTNIVNTGVFHVLTDNNTTYTPAGLGFGYGTCTTAASTAAKVVTLGSYGLTTGGMVSVRFTYDVPANATMNINGKGAKNIFYNNAKITAGVIHAGDIATFVYDGTQYRLIAINTDITNKQEKLVSGTNIKTINGESLLGSGDIEIQGGSEIPTVTLEREQFISVNEIQLTQEQYDILTTNPLVVIDATSAGMATGTFQCGLSDSSSYYAMAFGAYWSDTIEGGSIYMLEISTSKVATVMLGDIPTISKVHDMIEEYLGEIENGSY